MARLQPVVGRLSVPLHCLGQLPLLKVFLVAVIVRHVPERRVGALWRQVANHYERGMRGSIGDDNEGRSMGWTRGREGLTDNRGTKGLTGALRCTDCREHLAHACTHVWPFKQPV